jgi:GDPmannose 4,6-dehydratase
MRAYEYIDTRQYRWLDKNTLQVLNENTKQWENVNFMNDIQKKIIVTGVTGQDGSYMVDYLLTNTPHFIYGMIRRTAKPDFSNLTKSIKNPRFKLVTGDLSDSTSLDNLVNEIKPDYFINLAAQSFVKASWDIPEQTFDVGATGVLRCLEAIRKHAPECRFYNAGSSEELGDVVYIPQGENHPLRPRSPYGAAKAASRHLVKVYRESYDLYAVQGLLFNHESERRGEEFITRKVSLGVARIKAAQKNNIAFLPIELGNLDAKRDWSHAYDFVDGIWRMLNQENYRKGLFGNFKNADSKTLSKNIKEYVLASGETHTVREFVEKAFAVAGIDGVWKGSGKDEVFHYVYDETPLVKINPIFYRPAEVDLLLGDPTLAKTELDWKPQVSFDELVARMVRSDINATRS